MSLTFTVSAVGPGALSYQWKKDGECITDDVYPNCTGALTSNLHIKSFSSVHVGSYSCRVSNEYDDIVDSSGAELKGKYL